MTLLFSKKLELPTMDEILEDIRKAPRIVNDEDDSRCIIIPLRDVNALLEKIRKQQMDEWHSEDENQ